MSVPIPAVVTLWAAVVLVLDTAASLTQQRLLGLGTWALLLTVPRGEVEKCVGEPVRINVQRARRPRGLEQPGDEVL